MITSELFIFARYNLTLVDLFSVSRDTEVYFFLKSAGVIILISFGCGSAVSLERNSLKLVYVFAAVGVGVGVGLGSWDCTSLKFAYVLAVGTDLIAFCALGSSATFAYVLSRKNNCESGFCEVVCDIVS